MKKGKARAELGGIVTGGSLMHSDEPKPDFSGWATKANLKCSDGRTIMPDAFKHQDKTSVPLVWQHTHSEPSNVLGHAVLENRPDGVYAYGYFNDSEQAKNAKTLVEHGDIKSLSIFANQLKEQANNVLHGIIREISLVLAGANPGALIDNITLSHADGEDVVLDDEAVIYTGLELEHAEGSNNDDNDGPTIQEVYDGMTDEQKSVVHYMVGEALEEAKTDDKAAAAAHSALPAKTGPNNNDGKDGRRMSRNVFEQNGGGSGSGAPEKHTLSHDDIRGIAADAVKRGSLKDAVEAYALSHGIEDIDVLFPDARNVTQTPEFDSRRTEWVSSVLKGTRHSPFSRIKSIVADITVEEARARGYIKGNFKKEEWFGLAKRTTTPTTVYKKQKLDRDDIIDITDFDVVIWLKAEMRLMLDEEIARAILIGDGREIADEDKIKDPAGVNEGAGIRSILNDHELYAARVNVNIDDASSSPVEIVEAVMRNMRFYKGSGSPTFFTTTQTLTSLLLAKDGMNRRLWRNASELANEMGVSSIQTVEVMEGPDYEDVIGIIVNLSDYTVGADRGGDIAMFDDFDIDYNQYKYLIETRASGALTKIRSALVVLKTAGANVLIVPEEPSFDGVSVTIPMDANVNYTNADTGAALADGAVVAVAEGSTLRVHAAPVAGYYFETDQQDDWSFTNEA